MSKKYVIIDAADVSSVDFTQVMETSTDTVRKSIDESQFILKWYTKNVPTFIADNSVNLAWSGSHSDCLTKLTSSFWTDTGSMP